MINKQTIISAYDEKLTLLQWLKLVNKALDEAVLTNVEINQRGNATFVFVFTFEDGTKVESNEIIVNKGDSVNGATIRNGHLYLSLTNGDELDAGNVKPVTSFEINASQHLVVNYGDGTSQDLGPIFQGNVNIDGNFTANSIIEKSANYSIVKPTTSVLQQSTTITYAGVVKNGNKITFAVAGNIAPSENLDVGVSGTLVVFNGIDPLVGAKIIPINDANHVSINQLQIARSLFDTITLNTIFVKNSNTSFYIHIHNNDKIMESGKTYNFRYEITFLLSDNLAV